MAKGRSHSRSRDLDTIATEYVLETVRPTWLSRPVLDPLHDLRLHHPYRELLAPIEVLPGRAGSSWSGRPSWSGSRPARMSEVRVNLGHAVRSNRFGNPIFSVNRQRAIWAFRSPKRVPICVRRYSRRQVLFAKGRVGRGYRKPRWNERSYMRCR